jgi:hypothetical protein
MLFYFDAQLFALFADTVGQTLGIGGFVVDDKDGLGL